MDFHNPTPSQVDATVLLLIARLLDSKRHPIRAKNLAKEWKGITKLADQVAPMIDTLKTAGWWPQPVNNGPRELIILGGAPNPRPRGFADAFGR